MVDEDYEILPHKLLSELKDEVEALKKKLIQPDRKAEELILEIESLKDSIHDLHTVFEKALQETKDEDPYKMIQGLAEKTDSVISQNEIIAKGMIAISDKLEDFMSKQGGIPLRSNITGPAPTPKISNNSGMMNQHVLGAPTPVGPGRMAPMPQMDAGEMDFPPPPPSSSMGGKKRAGLFR